MSSPLEIRCTCSRSPLLAVAGSSDEGPFIHVKAYKQQKIITELVVTSGIVRLRCRNCNRWLTLNVKTEKVTARNEPLPPSITL